MFEMKQCIYMFYKVLSKIYMKHDFIFFQKSLNLESSEDDPQITNMLFQSTSLSLQLAQSFENLHETESVLFQPMLERESEMLQNLCKLSMNVAYTRDSLKSFLQSSGLYVLTLCFNPGKLYYPKTILDIGENFEFFCQSKYFV